MVPVEGQALLLSHRSQLEVTFQLLPFGFLDLVVAALSLWPLPLQLQSPSSSLGPSVSSLA